jgi:hypothetical protein
VLSQEETKRQSLLKSSTWNPFCARGTVIKMGKLRKFNFCRKATELVCPCSASVFRDGVMDDVDLG